jgi:hypothetical protein
VVALTCPREHLRAEHGYYKRDGWQRCRACDRERRGRPTAYFGTHCVRGHRKTAHNTRWITDGFRCMDCRREHAKRRKERLTPLTRRAVIAHNRSMRVAAAPAQPESVCPTPSHS